MRKMAALLCLALMFLSTAGCNSPAATESQSRPNKDQQNDVMRYGPGLVIHHETPNLAQLAQRVFENFLQFEESKGCPETSRIKDYRIESIQMKDSNATDLVFSVSYAILPATDQYCLAGNGQREKDGWISHIFNFVKVHRKDNTFNIVETATSPIPN
ncbi:hypothetical protein CEB3_c12260 [Peptococcaceae bacterium CEB3]|nr:hypothetical protein CEB3_c12260 [Peptococcaceae bacterium CEB3]